MSHADHCMDPNCPGRWEGDECANAQAVGEREREGDKSPPVVELGNITHWRDYARTMERERDKAREELAEVDAALDAHCRRYARMPLGENVRKACIEYQERVQSERGYAEAKGRREMADHAIAKIELGASASSFLTWLRDQAK